MGISRIINRVAVMLATGLGLGLIPFASGTFGTLLALPIVWFFWDNLGCYWGWQAALAAGLSVVAIPICGAAERHYGTKDDGRIVADEYLTFPLCMIGLPWNPWVVLMAFLTCRCFDIFKPAPANQLQAVKGGLGIVIDDVVASVYSLAVNHAIYWLILRRLLLATE
ncbi:MAG TPA: phosphatidylglycerophosphatase A [Verrucomicrobia bacterium]|nr:phosphatidylglycerophosphatase A [Verrucomicrobiota bacterium]